MKVENIITEDFQIYISKEENDKIEKMIDDLEDFLIEVEKLDKEGLIPNNGGPFRHLADAQDDLQAFLFETDGLEEDIKEVDK